MHVELAVPIRHHRLMVIGPASTICLGRMRAVGTERLDIAVSYTHLAASSEKSSSDAVVKDAVEKIYYDSGSQASNAIPVSYTHL